MKTVKDYIRTIVDFPHEGIMFRDVTTLFADPRGFRMCIDQLLHPMPGCGSTRWSGWRRGASSWAARWRISCRSASCRSARRASCRGRRSAQAYTLEYGEAVVEVHDDAMQPGEKVLLVDDLLATGGTAEAGIKLIERLGAKVIGCAFVVDLPELGGRREAGSDGHGGTCALHL